MNITNNLLRAIIGVGLVVGMPITTTYAVSKSAGDLTAAQSARLATIISKGDQEITRRLTRLNTLGAKISGAPRLTASDKSMLSLEVTSEISGLTALKTKLDAETTSAAAGADARSIYNDYRVYALLVPKVNLVRIADDQQAVEAHLSTALQNLQANLTAAKDSGKDVASSQTALTDAAAKIQAATAISSGIEAKVIALQPSDYNGDHAILQGDYKQLLTARADNKAALADLKSVDSGLKQLSTSAS